MQRDITIVGAGLVGSLLAIYLARRELQVRMYERRADLRRASMSAGRSINLAVSARGLHALEQVGLKDAVLQSAVPMRGRMMHRVDGALSFQPYGKDDSQCIYSVSRGQLNALLLSQAEATGRVSIQFESRVENYDPAKRVLRVINDATNGVTDIEAPLVFGADGSASAVREAVILSQSGTSLVDTLNHGYKELTIPPRADGGFALDKHALHIWPRGSYMLIALPNADGSFTCTLFLPNDGPLSFATLTDAESIGRLFQEQFPDVVDLIPDLTAAFLQNPKGHLVTIKSWPWHIDDRALLIGDAAHGIVPFFGQGMNAGFEDVVILDELIQRLSSGEGTPPNQPNWQAVFEAFSQQRKPDADAIADMALDNFIEMRDRVADAKFLLRKSVEIRLQQAFPELYRSRYALVSFSRVPYRTAARIGALEDEVLQELCDDLHDADAVDLDKAQRLIRERLATHADPDESYETHKVATLHDHPASAAS